VIALVTGGRTYEDGGELWSALDQVHDRETITLLVLGGAKGADEKARKWAMHRQVPHLVMPAPWDRRGKRAGTDRNTEMILPPEGIPPYTVNLVIYVHGGRGTAHMVRLARELGVRTWTPYPELDNWPD
jgi:hypothetical protein